MIDKLEYDNSRHLTKERLEQLEVQVIDINCNANLLIVVLTNKLKLLKKDGGANAKFRLEGNQGIRKNQRSLGKPKKSSRFYALNHSQSLFKMEAKVDIKMYYSESIL